MSAHCSMQALSNKVSSVRNVELGPHAWAIALLLAMVVVEVASSYAQQGRAQSPLTLVALLVPTYCIGFAKTGQPAACRGAR
mmetsp:Transcript_47144/g.125948  ORF Transcript_47144/g.125948 Transcript_47144/m.125948 type:complete len:82 (-) Transcript_47144:77-322(-)